jgi:DNA-binding IscR family transcriptional regulator
MTSLEISQAMVIPRNYQLKITGPLVKAGILKRTQGMKGGFCLGRAAETITLYDIVDVNSASDRRKLQCYWYGSGSVWIECNSYGNECNSEWQ